MTDLSTKAINEGTYIITCAFTDADGTAVTPNSLTWDLTDYDGNVINSRSSVAIAIPSTSNTIVLGALDLDNEQGNSRVFTIEGTYDSITYGNGLPLRGQANFTIGLWVE